MTVGVPAACPDAVADAVAALMATGMLAATAEARQAAGAVVGVTQEQLGAALDRRRVQRQPMAVPVQEGYCCAVVEAALEAVAARSGYTVADLRGLGRYRPLIWWRHVAYAAARRAGDGRLSYPMLAEALGRDHTTVHHGVRQVATELSLAELAEDIAAQVRQTVQGRRAG